MKYLRSERLETNSSFSQKASRANDKASQFSLRGFVFNLVREVGLEPTRHCCRQDLNLVRLPISPLSRVFAASLKRGVQRMGPTTPDRVLPPLKNLSETPFPPAFPDN